MKKVSKGLLEGILSQMNNRARDIDLAVYCCLMDDLDKEVVLDALSMYLNEDGGFGNGLELDNLNPNSTPITTCCGLDILKLVGFDSNTCNDYFIEVINGCFEYLFKILRNSRWEFCVESNNDYPCANWWKFDSDMKLNNNPTAKVLGHAIYFLNADSNFYQNAISMVDDVLTTLISLEVSDKHEIDCYNVLLDSLKYKNITNDLIEKASSKLYLFKKEMICKEKSLFSDYESNLPLNLFNTYVDDDVNCLINEHLDYLIESLPSHCLWEANWSWGNNYPEEESALLKWMGCITYRNLYLLKKFNRIEK